MYVTKNPYQVGFYILSLPSTVLRFYSIVVIAIARMTIKMKKKIIEIML